MTKDCVELKRRDSVYNCYIAYSSGSFLSVSQSIDCEYAQAARASLVLRVSAISWLGLVTVARYKVRVSLYA